MPGDIGPSGSGLSQPSGNGEMTAAYPGASGLRRRRRWLNGRIEAGGGPRWSKGMFGSSTPPLETSDLPETSPSGRWQGRRWSSRMLHRLGEITAHAWAGVGVTLVVLGWVADGLLTGFTQRWQAVLSSTTAVVTVVMVFAIQHSQTREQAAVQRKLDELLRALPQADNRLISVEAAPDDELEALAELNLADRQAGDSPMATLRQPAE